MLDVRAIGVAYGSVEALREVSLHVERGSITTIIGSNGAGKSTCLKAVSGIVRVVAGEIAFEGRSIKSLVPEARLRLGIAHVLEGRRLFTELTVEENLELGAYARQSHHGAKVGIARDRDAMLERFPVLAERRAQPAGTMSGGEQQMLAIASALMARPKLLLLDEPSLGLAPKIVELVAALIRELRGEGLTILLVEQQASMAVSLADMVYVLERGCVRASGAASAMVADAEIQNAYFGPAAS